MTVAFVLRMIINVRFTAKTAGIDWLVVSDTNADRHMGSLPSGNINDCNLRLSFSFDIFEAPKLLQLL